MDRSPRIAAIAVLVLLLAAATLLAGCTRQQSLSVTIADHPTYGKVLTDSAGKSLYIQASDAPNTGAVSNLGEISHFYPPFYAETVSEGNGINISEFGFITRADGRQQTTFRGWPLYYYINDRAAGEAKSQGANNITFLAKPDYTVMVRENATLGVYLTDPAGSVLVVRDNESAGLPPSELAPFRVAPIVGPSPLIRAADFGEAEGPTGATQTTYLGQALYVYSDRIRHGGLPQDGSGFRPIVLAPKGTPPGSVEGIPTAAPSPHETAAGPGTAQATARPRTDQATAAPTTRPGYDAYTGGKYTPTPYRTAEVVRHSTTGVTPAPIWTPVTTAVQPTAPSPTPLPTVPVITTGNTISSLPTTVPPATPTTIPTAITTAVPVTSAPPTTMSTLTQPTTAPTSSPPTIPVYTTTVTTTATTVPQPFTTLPTSAQPTTLPLPFPITTNVPAPLGPAAGGDMS